MACDVCGGGDNNLHFLNDDPTVDDIVTDGNLVWHPRPARPDEWCIHQLRNVTRFQLEGDDLAPMVWDAERCIMGPGQWPCPDVREWSSEFAQEPPADECGECADDGVWTMWIDTNQGSIATHVCVDGTLIKLGGSGSGGAGGCCTEWLMADQNCNPIFVVYSPDFGWKFFDSDHVQIPRPNDLQPGENCFYDPCPVTRSDNGDGTMTISDCHGTYEVQLANHHRCCYNAVDANGDRLMIDFVSGVDPEVVNLTSGGDLFATPLVWAADMGALACCFVDRLCDESGNEFFHVTDTTTGGVLIYEIGTLIRRDDISPGDLVECGGIVVNPSCTAVDVLDTTAVTPGDTTTLTPLLASSAPAGTTVQVLSGTDQNVVNATVNGDGSVVVTVGGVECKWAIEYQLTCPDGSTSTAWLYGNAAANTLGANVVNDPNFAAGSTSPVPAGSDFGGGWSASIEYVGQDIWPPNTTVSTQTGHSIYPEGADQVPFPGDPIYDVPANNTWLYSNGNTTGAEYVSAQQDITIQPGATYEFYAYTSSAVSPTFPGGDPTDDSVLQFTIDGADFGPGFIELDHQDPTSPDNGADLWHRRAWTWTAPGALTDPPTTVTFALLNTATGGFGNDVALTAVSFREVLPCDHYAAGDPFTG